MITKIEAGQLVHFATRFANRYPEPPAAVPLLIHPSEELSSDAQLPVGARVMTRAHIGALRLDLEGFVNELAAARSWSDPSAGSAASKTYKLTAEQVIARDSKVIKQG